VIHFKSKKLNTRTDKQTYRSINQSIHALIWTTIAYSGYNCQHLWIYGSTALYKSALLLLCSFILLVYVPPNYVFPAMIVVFVQPLGKLRYVIPRTHRCLANHAFVIAAPPSWNCLPDNVRNWQSYIPISYHTNFLSKLKTYYFNSAFYDLYHLLLVLFNYTLHASELQMESAIANPDDMILHDIIIHTVPHKPSFQRGILLVGLFKEPNLGQNWTVHDQD